MSVSRVGGTGQARHRQHIALGVVGIGGLPTERIGHRGDEVPSCLICKAARPTGCPAPSKTTRPILLASVTGAVSVLSFMVIRLVKATLAAVKPGDGTTKSSLLCSTPAGVAVPTAPACGSGDLRHKDGDREAVERARRPFMLLTRPFATRTTSV